MVAVAPDGAEKAAPVKAGVCVEPAIDIDEMRRVPEALIAIMLFKAMRIDRVKPLRQRDPVVNENNGYAAADSLGFRVTVPDSGLM